MMYGVSSMTAPLKRVAVRNPGPSLLNADTEKWHYGASFNPQKVESEHDEFTTLLRLQNIEVISMDNSDMGIADAVFTYDASLLTPAGAILMSPGKTLRSGEQEIHRDFYISQGIPIVGEVTGTATAEAGDTLWLDNATLVIGRGFRTSTAGCSQLSELLTAQGVTTFEFDLPVFRGRAVCLHLMSLISLVDTKTALVCLPLLPVGLLELLKEKGFRVIEANYDEFLQSETLSTNVLATAPGKCIMIKGFEQTQYSLQTNEIDVQVFSGDALCIGCEGGPTCLTRPLYRQ